VEAMKNLKAGDTFKFRGEKIQIKIENPAISKKSIVNNQPPITDNAPIKITIKPEVSTEPKPKTQPDINNSDSPQTPPTASKIDL